MDYQSEYILKNPTLHIEDAPVKYRELMLEMSKLKETPSSLLDVGCRASGFLIINIWNIEKHDRNSSTRLNRGSH